MKKCLVDRIAYYTRKVAEFGSVHPSRKQPVAYTYRQERLMDYKKRMHNLIEEEGYKR